MSDNTSLTVAQLKAALKTAGVSFPSRVTKGELVALLDAAQRTPKVPAPRKGLGRVLDALGGVAQVADEAAVMIDALHAIHQRVTRAPAHVVALAGIVNGMDPIEINRRVIAVMDEHGIE